MSPVIIEVVAAAMAMMPGIPSHRLSRIVSPPVWPLAAARNNAIAPRMKTPKATTDHLPGRVSGIILRCCARGDPAVVMF